jgi:hypothetical protein
MCRANYFAQHAIHSSGTTICVGLTFFGAIYLKNKAFCAAGMIKLRINPAPTVLDGSARVCKKTNQR